MGIFNFKSRKKWEAEIHNKYQRMVVEALAGNSVWNGEKFRGSLGLVKVFNSIDYWTLRQKSQELWTDSPYARGILRRILRNEIFTGLTANSSPNEDVLWPGMDDLERSDLAVKYGDLITSQFSLYANNYELFDYGKELTFGEFQELVRREALLCGDGIIVARVNHTNGLPMWQWINGNYIKTPADYTCKDGNRIVQGVELDKYNRHVAYFVQTTENGVLKSERIPVKGEKSGRQISWMVYGSEKMSDKVRGEPLLANVLSMLSDVDKYKDAELRAAVINALIAFTVKKSPDTPFGTRPTMGLERLKKDDIKTGIGSEVPPKGHQPIQLMQPGTVFDDLAPGEEVVSYQTNRPNVNFSVFEAAIIDAICWSLEIPPEIAKLKFTSSYSASRQANNEFEVYLKYRNFKNAKDFCQIIYEEFVIQAVLSGMLSLPGFIPAFIDPKLWQIKAAWLSCTWSGIARPSVERTKDVKAANDALDNGLTTFDDECRRINGKSFRKVAAQLKREINYAHQLGFNPHILENNNGEPAYSMDGDGPAKNQNDDNDNDSDDENNEE